MGSSIQDACLSSQLNELILVNDSGVVVLIRNPEIDGDLSTGTKSTYTLNIKMHTI